MNPISVLAIVATAATASLVLSTAPALAASSPVSAVAKHGIYETVVTCPSWAGPAGTIKPLLAAPLVPRDSTSPTTATAGPASRNTRYNTIATCTVMFLKDGPVKPRSAIMKLCSRAAWMHGHRRRWEHGKVRPTRSACFSLDAGFGGMAQQVSRHSPAAASSVRAHPRRRQPA